jgi:hypothetical protein
VPSSGYVYLCYVPPPFIPARPAFAGSFAASRAWPWFPSTGSGFRVALFRSGLTVVARVSCVVAFRAGTVGVYPAAGHVTR